MLQQIQQIYYHTQKVLLKIANQTNLSMGSIFSLTSARSMLDMFLHLLSSVLMHAERGWHEFTKSNSNIIAFRRFSSGFYIFE